MSLSECGTTMQVAPIGYSGGNGMWGDGNGAWWIIILFLFAFCGWGGNRGLGGDSNGGTMEGYVLTSDFATLERKLDGVNNGLCDGFYAVAQQFSSLQNGVNQGFAGLNTVAVQGFAGVDRAVCNLQAQISSCCCDLREAISGVNYNAAMNSNAIQGAIRDGFCQTNYNAATNTRDIIEAQNASTRAILDKLTAQEIAAKDATITAQTQQIFGLQLKASQEAQNAYLVNQLRPCPQPAYLTCNPFTGQSFTGYNGGYGCGCGA